MRDDEIRRILIEANPWWRSVSAGRAAVLAAVADHRLLRDRARYDLGYRSEVLSDVGSAPLGDGLILLTGPRRVGKSVALLDLVGDLCARGDVEAHQVLYVPCDGMAGRDLRRTFSIGRELTRPVDRDGRRRRAWLLDEIASVAGWTAVVKAARDGTAVGDDTVVITGSRWRDDEDVEGNLLAGRAGTTGARRVRHLFPMTFRDFLSATRRDLAAPDSVHPADVQLGSVARTLEDLHFDVDAYDLAWQDFLSCGGFPRAVAEHSATGGVSDDFLRDIAASMRGDIRLEGPPESLPLLIDQLTRRATSPLNITRTADALGWTRPVTEGRLNRLVRGFAALWCRQHDDTAHQVPGSQPKLYLVDPLLGWLPGRLRAGLPAPEMPALTEQVVATTLARTIDALDEGRWVSGDTVGYVRTGSGNEVDLGPAQVPSPGGYRPTVPIEVKWVDANWRSEAKVIENKYRLGVLATKSVLDLTHPTWAVPAPLLTLLLA